MGKASPSLHNDKTLHEAQLMAALLARDKAPGGIVTLDQLYSGQKALAQAIMLGVKRLRSIEREIAGLKVRVVVDPSMPDDELVLTTGKSTVRVTNVGPTVPDDYRHASGKIKPQGGAWRKGWEAAANGLAAIWNPYKTPARGFQAAWDEGWTACKEAADAADR